MSNGDCGHDVLNRAMSGKSMKKNFQNLWVCGVVIILINWLTSFLHSSYTSINPILDLFPILLSMHPCPRTLAQLVSMCAVAEPRFWFKGGKIERQYLK